MVLRRIEHSLVRVVRRSKGVRSQIGRAVETGRSRTLPHLQAPRATDEGGLELHLL